MANVLIGVTGGIAAYKIPSVVSVLKKKGHEVKVIMTEAAKQFITPLTFSSLSKNPVYGEHNRFANDGHIHHIELSEWADVFIIAPATYNTISKMIHRIADNLLTSTIAAYDWKQKGKILVFSAMNTKMYDNILGKLRLFNVDHGNGREAYFRTIGPAKGTLACGAYGLGKLISTRKIVEATEYAINKDWHSIQSKEWDGFDD